jgi:rhamnose transport system permease protein
MNRNWLVSWEGLLAVILLVVIFVNMQLSSNYLTTGNLINVFELSIEKIIIALIMAFIIINGEIDLSVGSIMGLSACTFAWLYREGTSTELAIVLAIGAGGLCGLFNGFWVAVTGLPSMAVTLAGLIGYRGLARVMLEDKSISDFPAWFNDLGQRDFIGVFPAALILFFLMFILFAVVLHMSSFGRYVYIIGNNKEAAIYSGVKVRRIKWTLLTLSGLISGMAGVLYAARLGTVRANAAEGFELDIITMVLLGGVSIFGGTGTLVGVGLSILVVLNIRNGMSLADYPGNIQTSVVGVLLILSVLLPNLAREARQILNRRKFAHREERSVARQSNVQT